MEAAEVILATRAGGFIAGFCVAVGLVAGVLSIAFYFEFKKKFLLHFAFVSSMVYACMVLANKNPRDLAELRGDPILFRMFHLMITVAIYHYFRLMVTTIHNEGTRAYKVLKVATFLAVVSRLIVVVSGSPDTFPLAALFSVIFLTTSVVVNIRWKPPSLSHRLCQWSSIGMMSLIFYPLIRSGVLPETSFEGLYVWIILAFVTTSSVVWLFGLVQLAREEAQAVRNQEIKTREKAFYDLRDFMNTPLQVLLSAIEVSENGKETDLSKKMKRAVTRLSNINIFLGRYAKDSDWTKRDRFFNEKDLEDPPKR